jgi:hypothetical protein
MVGGFHVYNSPSTFTIVMMSWFSFLFVFLFLLTNALFSRSKNGHSSQDREINLSHDCLLNADVSPLSFGCKVPLAFLTRHMMKPCRFSGKHYALLSFRSSQKPFCKAVVLKHFNLKSLKDNYYWY